MWKDRFNETVDVTVKMRKGRNRRWELRVKDYTMQT
jgi:hypothetical protein